MLAAIPLIIVFYSGVGFFVGLAFVVRGVDRVDPAAVGSGLVFRVMILPGCIGLWPAVLMFWRGAGRQHRQAEGAGR